MGKYIEVERALFNVLGACRLVAADLEAAGDPATEPHRATASLAAAEAQRAIDALVAISEADQDVTEAM